MANVDAAYGLLPVTSATGAASNYEMRQVIIAYDNTTKIYRGDPVKQLNTGYVGQWTAGTAVSQLVGIFWGCEYLSSAQSKKVFSQYWPGTDVASTAQTSIVGWVIPCNQGSTPTFRAQSDSTGIAIADIGLNIDVALGTGSTITGASKAYLDVTTMNTTNTLPFRIVGLYGGVPGAGGFGGIQPSSTNPYGGSSTGAYNWALVTANVTGSTGI